MCQVYLSKCIFGLCSLELNERIWNQVQARTFTVRLLRTMKHLMSFCLIFNVINPSFLPNFSSVLDPECKQNKKRNFRLWTEEKTKSNKDHISSVRYLFSSSCKMKFIQAMKQNTDDKHFVILFLLSVHCSVTEHFHTNGRMQRFPWETMRTKKWCKGKEQMLPHRDKHF